MKIKSAPIFFWVQDLWPESLFATGAVRSSVVISLVETLVRFIYSHCDRILVQSRSFIDAIVKTGVDGAKLEYFPNSAEAIFDGTPDAAVSLRHIVFPKGFRVMFAGNIGVSQDFETILSAAKLLREYRSIHWIIVGDGRKLPWVRQQLKIRELEDTVHLLGRHPLVLMPAFYARADFMLVTLKKDPIFALTVPAKVQSYLACSRPIIAALDGEGARIVEEAGAGLACPAEQPELLAKTVLRAYNMTVEDRERMGLNGRIYFEKNFESNMLLDRLNGWFLESASQNSEFASADRSGPRN